MNNNIVLIGFASTGKSAVGRQIASAKGYSFIDLDITIEQIFKSEKNEHLSCRQIYTTYGAEFFLDIEFRSLLKIQHSVFSVIATGGGAAIQQKNQPVIKSLGTVIYLYAEPEALLERMKDKGLPAWLQDNPTLENLTNRWQARHPVYSKVADHIIDTTNKDIATVTAEVLKIT